MKFVTFQRDNNSEARFGFKKDNQIIDIVYASNWVHQTRNNPSFLNVPSTLKGALENWTTNFEKIKELNELLSKHDLISISTSEFQIATLEKLEVSAEFNFIIDAVGYSTTREIACRLCVPGGVIIHIGLGDGRGGIDVRRMTLQEITFIGTYTYTPVDFRETANAIFSSQMGDFGWIEKRPLSDGHHAFMDLLKGTVAASKIILNP